MDTKNLLDSLHPIIGFLGDHPYIKALVILIVAFSIANLVSFLITRLIGVLVKRTGNKLDDAIMSILRLPLYWTFIFIGALLALQILKLPASPAFFLHGVILTCLVLIWSFFLESFFRIIIRALSRRAKTHSIIRPQTLPLFNNIALVLVLLAAIYLVFQTWDIDMTAWLASAGIVGIAVGFAAKDTLANLFAGVFILADSPYKIGDYVVLESGERGKVTHIGIRSTRLLTRDDVEVTIPNSIMGNTRVVNESGGPYEKFRIRIPVGVSYESDIDKVREILMQVAQNEPKVCHDPAPRVRFRRFGASSLDFELLCWVENPEQRGMALDILNTAIFKSFKRFGIEIPYSKHDIYIKQMPDYKQDITEQH